MSTKRFKELKELSKDELAGKVRQLESSLFQSKLKSVTGQLEDHSQVWKQRKDLARVRTLQSQSAATQASKK